MDLFFFCYFPSRQTLFLSGKGASNLLFIIFGGRTETIFFRKKAHPQKINFFFLFNPSYTFFFRGKIYFSIKMSNGHQKLFYLTEMQQAPKNFVLIRSGASCYAIHPSLARQCRILDAVLDQGDLQPRSDETSPSLILPTEFPQATLETVFLYLSLWSSHVPSIIGRPLCGPFHELVQPWELNFVQQHGLSAMDPMKHEPLIDMMKLADFLVIDPLRDLCCAFLASLVLSCSSEGDLLKLLGGQQPLSERELKNVYEQFPFLQPRS